MKTFRQLSINDSIYKVVITHRSMTIDTAIGKPSPINEIKVSDLQLKNGELLINKHTAYSGSDWYDLVLKTEDQDLTSINYTGGNSNSNGFLFINEDEANEHVKKMVIERIRECERTIVNTTLSENSKIKNLRNDYHEILNPSFHKDFKILTN